MERGESNSSAKEDETSAASERRKTHRLSRNAVCELLCDPEDVGQGTKARRRFWPDSREDVQRNGAAQKQM